MDSAVAPTDSRRVAGAKSSDRAAPMAALSGFSVAAKHPRQVRELRGGRKHHLPRPIFAQRARTDVVPGAAAGVGAGNGVGVRRRWRRQRRPENLCHRPRSGGRRIERPHVPEELLVVGAVLRRHETGLARLLAQASRSPIVLAKESVSDTSMT